MNYLHILLSLFITILPFLYVSNTSANTAINGVKHPLLGLTDAINSDSDLNDDQKKALEFQLKEIESEKSKIQVLQTQIEFQKEFLVSSSDRANRLKLELSKPINIKIPSAWKRFNLSKIKQELLKQESQELSSQKRLDDIQQEIKQITAERVKLPQRIADYKSDLEELSSKLNKFQGSETERRINDDFLTQYQARLELEVIYAEKQLLNYEKRQEFLKLSEQSAVRKVTKNKELRQFLKDREYELAKEEAELVTQQAQIIRQRAATSDPLIQKIAENNMLLAKRRTGPDGLKRKIQQAEKELSTLTQLNYQLERSQQKLVEKVNVAGMTDVIGILFRKQRSELPNLRQYNLFNKRRRAEISRIQLEILQIEEQLRDERDIDTQLVKLAKNVSSKNKEDLQQILVTAERLLKTRLGYLENLLKDLNSYFLVMVDLDAISHQYLAKATELTTYIDENILWIRSNRVLGRYDMIELVSVLEWFTRFDNWLSVYRVLEESFSRNIIPTMLFCILLLLQVGIRTRLLRLLKILGDDVKQSYVTSFRKTLKAFFVTVVLALLLPTVFGGIAWFLREADPNLGSDFSNAVARGFVLLTGYSLLLRFIESLVIQKGLAQAHFLWVSKGVEIVRINLRWLVPLFLASVFLYGTTQDHPHPQAQDTLGRMIFIFMLFGLALFIQRVFNPSNQWMQDYFSRSGKSWIRKFSWAWFPTVVLVPPLLAILSAAGYHYTGLQMMLRFQSTVILLLAIVLFKSLAYRLTFNLRRSLAMERIEKKVQGYANSADEVAVKEAEAAHQTEIPVIHLQTQRFLNGVSSLLFLLGVLGIWVDVFPAFGVLNKIELWYDIQQTSYITLGHIFSSILVVALTAIAVNNLPGLLEISILRKLNSEPAQSYAIVTVFRYSLIVIGVGVAFGQIGIGWGKVQWLAAAFTVGLGFGLQEIFANFVAGLIILFEQPIRLGDTVTVANTSGTVSKIRIRATTITDFNRKELIIPNKEFIIGQLVNWSLSDRLLRLQIPVGVSYGTDSRRVENILYQVARNHPSVVDEPEPRIIFHNLGDSALEFDVRVFIRDIEIFAVVRSQIMHEVYQALTKEGITIPFPQRDLHIKEIPEISKIKNIAN